MEMEMQMTKEAKRWFLVEAWRNVGTLFRKLKEKCLEFARNIKKLAKDDPRRVTHSFKMALALTLVSSVYYVRPLYDGFGISGMWAVLTVVVVFEFSVGATISKGSNRGFATLVAGALGVGAQHLAILFGKEGEPIVLGFFVFLLAAVSTFTRFIPGIKRRYDYGVLIFILTFSLVAVSGYRVDTILTLAYQRLVTILVGAACCIIVSIFVCPVWAGQDLHYLIAGNIEKLSMFLEGFGKEYSKELPDNDMDTTIISNYSNSFLQCHKSVLTSKNNEENLGNFARWEPFHGKFRLRHPWKQYLKIGTLARQCAYQIEALTACINFDAKASIKFRRQIQGSCTKMSMESSKALKAMASSIKTMAQPNQVQIHVENAKEAAKDLEAILKTTSYGRDLELVVLVPDATIASILANITDSVEKISEAVGELATLASFKPVVDPSVSPETKLAPSARLHRGIVNPIIDEGEGERARVDDHVAITIHNDQEPKREGNTICTNNQEEIEIDRVGFVKVENVNRIVRPPPILHACKA